MRPLVHPLLTPRLKIEPVTPALARAARAGQAVFAEVLGAEAPAEWCAGSLPLVARSAAAHAPFRAIAIHRQDGEVVGDVRFEPTTRPEGEVEIGYAIAQGRRRQGFAVEAAGAVIDWLFEDGGVEMIVAGCDRRNVASVKTLRRLGFWLDSTPGTTFWWLLNPTLRSATRA